MKHYIVLVFLVIHSSFLFSQRDTVISPWTISGEVGLGPAFVIFDDHPVLPHGYHLLNYNNSSYCDLKADINITWKEKIGIKIHSGKEGMIGGNFGFANYLSDAFPGYRPLNENVYDHSGYRYRYFSIGFLYCFHIWKLTLSPYAEIGTGNFEGAAYQRDMKDTASNNFFEVRYAADKKMNWNWNAGLEVTYCKRSSLHWNLAYGLAFDFTAVYSDFSYTYTEQFYQQPVSVNELYEVKDQLSHFSVDVFLKLQWKSKVSDIYYR